LTHHPRAPLVKQGGTTFTFVTDGIESALAQARSAAGDGHVVLAGGAHAAQQYLNANLLDEIRIDLVPVLLGGGARLFESVSTDVRLELARAVQAPGVAHLFYRVGPPR
jgi:dihydrofolate reductase